MAAKQHTFPLLHGFLIFFIHTHYIHHRRINSHIFYWGWDVTMNLGEETKEGTPEPASEGAFWAMVNLIIFFIIMMVVVLIVLNDDEIAKANTNVLYAIVDKYFLNRGAT